jgi:hypothetical protein
MAHGSFILIHILAHEHSRAEYWGTSIADTAAKKGSHVVVLIIVVELGHGR